MRYVTAGEAKQRLGRVLDCCSREPVVIRRYERDVAVVMSMQEYERLTHLNVAEFQRFCDAKGASAQQSGLTEERLADLLAPSLG